MRKILICAVLLIITSMALIGFDEKKLYKNFFNIYQDKVFTSEGLKKVENFDPDSTLKFFSLYENKEFFKSIDDLSICRRKEVRKYIYIYLTKGRLYVTGSINRSYRYMNTIKEIFEDYQSFPEDIMLLPLLESGFDPFAVSRTNATGLWQFVGSTGNILGLKKNRLLDERRHVRKSTKAALRHLNNIYPLFNSWELTLAAYNGGAGHVKRAMKKAGTNDFWELAESGYLRKETCEFVPRLAALIIIYNNRKNFGLLDEEGKVLQPNDTQLVTIPHSSDLKKIAELTGTPLKTIRSLNPELSRDITPAGYQLRLPVEAVQKLTEDEKPVIDVICF